MQINRYELSVNGKYLTLPDDFRPLFSATFTDPSNPNVRSSEFSYSFTLPADANNARILGATVNLHEIRKFSRSFRAILTIGDDVVFDGGLYIASISDDGYSCNLVRPANTAGELFGEEKIRDGRWIHDVQYVSDLFRDGKKFSYPLVAYGLLPKFQSSTITQTIDDITTVIDLYTPKNEIDASNYFSITDYPISINLKEGLRKIFEDKGMKLEGGFMDDSRTDKIFMSYSGKDNELPFNWGTLADFSLHLEYRSKWGNKTGKVYLSSQEFDKSRTLAVQDILNSPTTSIEVDSEGADCFYAHDDINGKNYIYIPATGYYVIDMSTQIELQRGLPEHEAYSDEGISFVDTFEFQGDDEDTPSDYRVGRYRGELQIHVQNAAERDPSSYKMLSTLGLPNLADDVIVPSNHSFMAIDKSLDEGFKMGCSFGYASGWRNSDMYQQYFQPEEDYVRPVNSDPFFIRKSSVCHYADGTQVPSGTYTLKDGTQFVVTTAHSILNYPQRENIMYQKAGWSDALSYVEDAPNGSLFVIPNRTPKYETSSYLNTSTTNASTKYRSSLIVPNTYKIDGRTSFGATMLQSNGPDERNCNATCLVKLKKGDRLYIDVVGRTSDMAGGRKATAALNVTLDLGIRYVTAEEIITIGDQYRETSYRLEDSKEKDLNLYSFMPDVTKSQFITDVCNAFNLSLVHDNGNAYALNYGKSASNGIYDMKERYSDDKYTILPLSIPYTYSISWKESKNEEGYDPKYQDGESGYDGNATIMTDNYTGTEYKRTTNFGMCWYKDFWHGEERLTIPIISERDVWIPDYIDGGLNPVAYNNYASDIAKKYFNLPVRLFYCNGKKSVVMNHEFDIPEGYGGFGITYDETVNGSLLQLFAPILSNEGYIYEREMYLNPVDYRHITEGYRIRLENDIYIPVSINGYDPAGVRPSKVRLAKLS